MPITLLLFHKHWLSGPSNLNAVNPRYSNYNCMFLGQSRLPDNLSAEHHLSKCFSSTLECLCSVKVSPSDHMSGCPTLPELYGCVLINQWSRYEAIYHYVTQRGGGRIVKKFKYLGQPKNLYVCWPRQRECCFC